MSQNNIIINKIDEYNIEIHYLKQKHFILNFFFKFYFVRIFLHNTLLFFFLNIISYTVFS